MQNVLQTNTVESVELFTQLRLILSSVGHGALPCTTQGRGSHQLSAQAITPRRMFLPSAPCHGCPDHSLLVHVRRGFHDRASQRLPGPPLRPIQRQEPSCGQPFVALLHLEGASILGNVAQSTFSRGMCGGCYTSHDSSTGWGIMCPGWHKMWVLHRSCPSYTSDAVEYWGRAEHCQLPLRPCVNRPDLPTATVRLLMFSGA